MRAARADDIASIAPWTQDTFDWGDYVPDSLEDWIHDEDSQVLVYADEQDTPVALAHVLMLSPREGWLEAARVHPDHQRSGMGSALNRAGVGWARDRGARVVRLAIELDNVPARRQVEALGYRHTSSWVFAEISIGSQPTCPQEHRLRPAPAPDIDPAWMFWSTSELYHRGRGLMAHRWRWRAATPEDLSQAAGGGDFYQSPSGWVIAQRISEPDVWVGWLATTHHEAPRMLEGVLDLGVRTETRKITLLLPDLAWTSEALARAGARPSRVLVYSLPIWKDSKRPTPSKDDK